MKKISVYLNFLPDNYKNLNKIFIETGKVIKLLFKTKALKKTF